jgi:excisionase family DNA binding protein
MTMLTLGEAAKMVGKSKPTISKAIKDGKLSGEKVGDRYQIEVSELLRVYPAQSDDPEPTTTPSAQSDDLEKKYMTEKISDLESRLDDMKDERDQALKDGREDRARMLALLSDQRPKSFWQRLTGK